jgi:hypothetical protein
MNRWWHRIDAVPAPGRRIEFKRPGATPRFGRIVRPYPHDTYRMGIGDDVRIDPESSTGVWLIPSLTYTEWRYADDGPADQFWDGD